MGIIQRDKEYIRKRVLKERRSLNINQVRQKSRDIVRRLTDSCYYRNASTVMCYSHIKNEVETDYLMKLCIMEGKILVLPLVSTKGHGPSLQLRRVSLPEKDLRRGAFGILEPVNDTYQVHPREVDLAVIPGVAFDAERNRIGYGKGYFDRFIPLLSDDCTKAGLAYEIQIVNKIPAESHDRKLDVVITEKRII